MVMCVVCVTASGSGVDDSSSKRKNLVGRFEETAGGSAKKKKGVWMGLGKGGGI